MINQQSNIRESAARSAGIRPEASRPGMLSRLFGPMSRGWTIAILAGLAWIALIAMVVVLLNVLGGTKPG